jgi:hypothetical protein
LAAWPLELLPRLIEGVSLYLEAAAQAGDLTDLFRRLEACGQRRRRCDECVGRHKCSQQGVTDSPASSGAERRIGARGCGDDRCARAARIILLRIFRRTVASMILEDLFSWKVCTCMACFSSKIFYGMRLMGELVTIA